MPSTIEDVFRTESRRVLATLIRLLGDFDLAEEALQDAFAAAVERWPADGVPGNPRAWLVSAGRFKAIDGLRRRARFDASLALGSRAAGRRRHPAARGGRREGRGRPAPAHLHLLPPCPAARRAGRAHPARSLRPHHRRDRPGVSHRRRPRWPSGSCGPRPRSRPPASRIRCRRGPTCPSGSRRCCTSSTWCSTRATAASSGESLTRHDLSGEAIRLGRLLVELLPEPEAVGLLALMLLHESRRRGADHSRRRGGAARRSGPRASGIGS